MKLDICQLMGGCKTILQLIDMRYEKRSTILTTNVNFKSWDEIFQDPKIANAILDDVSYIMPQL